jgi:hypothetical protein
VDDTGTRSPETDAILCARGLEEVINFVIDIDRAVKISARTFVSLDQVIAVHR